MATAKVSLVFLIKKKSLMGCLLLMFSIPLPSREKKAIRLENDTELNGVTNGIFYSFGRVLNCRQ